MTLDTPWAQLRPLPGEVGAWMDNHTPEGGSVGSVATTAFEAYAVVPNGVQDCSLSTSVAERLPGHLVAWTEPSEPCIQAIWEGHGGLGGGSTMRLEPRNPVHRMIQRWRWRHRMPLAHRDLPGVTIPRLLPEHVEREAVFEIPDRAYYAFAATLDDLGPRPWTIDDRDDDQGPNLFWPEARTWLVASEIDLVVTFVGGPRPLIDTLIGDPQLDASPVDADQGIPAEWTDVEE